MDPSIVIAAVVFVSVFGAALFLMAKAVPDDAQKHKRQLLRSLESQEGGSLQGDTKSILRGEARENPLNRVLMIFPGMEEIHRLIVRTGEAKPSLLKHTLKIIAVFVIFVLSSAYFAFNALFLVPIVLIIAFISPIMVTLVTLTFCSIAYSLKAPMIAFVPSLLIISYMLPKKNLQQQVEKRNQKFLDTFPDAMDMIVRSVRAGHPLSASLRMIAENIEPPISTEFKQVIDEISYGRTMAEALARMADRIDQPDLNYFVVVLSVQQETGGNLSEVLSNLSEIIRKRKMLRLKIRAMTAEARATGWVLGIMPIVIFGILYYMSPKYLMPLIEKPLGNMILVGAAGLIMLGSWIVSRMINVKV